MKAFGFPLPANSPTFAACDLQAYVISTCLKVWNATATSTVFDDSHTRRGSDAGGRYTLFDAAEAARPHRQQSSEPSFEDRFENFKRELVNVDQKYPIATLHIWIAFVGLAISFVLSVVTFGILASLCFYPGFIAMVLIIKLTYAFVRWIEDDLFKGKFRVKVTNLEVKGLTGGREGKRELELQKSQVKDEVEQFGEVTSVKVHGEDRGERRLAYALVTFVDSKSADACLRGLAGTRIGRKEVQVEMASPAVRMFTGWFHDMSVYMAQPRDNYFQGFRVLAVLQYPRLEFDADYRESEVGQVDVGGGDAGFVNMLYGFSVFFVCIALAPATCYGVLIGVPVLLGSLPRSEAIVLVRLYYEDWWAAFTSFMTALANFELHWDWPEWFNINAIVEFINDCWNYEWYKMFEEALNHIIDAVMFLNFDLDRLIEGSRALLRLNSVLAALKPLLALLLKLWVFSTGAFSRFMSQYSHQFFEVKSDYLRLIFFGNCVPGQADIKKAATLRELARNQNVPVPKLKQPPYSYSAAELKLGKYKAKDLLVVGGFSVEELLNAHYPLQQMHDAEVESRVLQELRVPLSQMREAGYTPSELKGTFSVVALKGEGFTAAELKPVFSARELHTGGYDVDALKTGGFDAPLLREEGFTAADLRQSFSVSELRAANFSVDELKCARYTPRELKDGGFSASDLKPSFSAAELRAASFSAAQVKVSGFSATQMLNGGFSMHDLKSGGFDTITLKADGFSVVNLKEAYSAAELKQAAFTAHDLRLYFDSITLKSAGFTFDELKGPFAIAQLRTAFTIQDMRAAGVTVSECRGAKISGRELQDGGYSVAELKSGGFDAAGLKAEGFHASDLTPSFSAAEMHRADFAAAELKACGFSAKKMRSVGYSVLQLKDGGFKAAALRHEGFSASSMVSCFSVPELSRAGFGASALKACSLTVSQLKDSFSIDDMRQADFSVAELRAEFSARDIHAIGFDMHELKNGGFTADVLRTEGFGVRELQGSASSPIFSAAELRVAGFPIELLVKLFNVAALKESGYKLAELSRVFEVSDLKAVFSIKEMKEGGMSARRLRDGGYDIDALKAGGFDAAALKQEGFGADELKSSFSAQDLRKARFSPSELRGAFPVAELKGAGFKLRELNGAFTLPELSVDFSPRDMKDGGISPREMQMHGGFKLAALKEGGFDAKALKEQGYNASELHEAFTAAELRRADFDAAHCRDHYSLEEMMAAFTTHQLKQAGFTAARLLSARNNDGQPMVSVKDLLKAHFLPMDLRDAGCSASDLRRDAGLKVEELKGLFRPAQLKEAGYAPAEFKLAHFNVKQIKEAGFSPADLAVGKLFTASQLRVVFSPAEMKQAFTASEMKKLLGLSCRELRTAGYPVVGTKQAGFTVREMRDAGYAVSELHTEFELSQLRSDSRINSTNLIPIGELFAGGVPLEAVRNERNFLNVRIWSDDQLRSAGYVLSAPAPAPAPESCANSTLTDLEGSGSTTPSLSIGQKVGDLI